MVNEQYNCYRICTHNRLTQTSCELFVICDSCQKISSASSGLTVNSAPAMKTMHLKQSSVEFVRCM